MTEQTMNQAIEKLAENYNQLEQSLVNQLRLPGAEPPVDGWYIQGAGLEKPFRDDHPEKVLY